VVGPYPCISGVRKGIFTGKEAAVLSWFILQISLIYSVQLWNSSSFLARSLGAPSQNRSKLALEMCCLVL